MKTYFKTFLIKKRVSLVFVEILMTIYNGLENLIRFIIKCFLLMCLAYPVRYIWNNTLTSLFPSLPNLTNIDQAIALLTIVAIVGWAFGALRRKR